MNQIALIEEREKLKKKLNQDVLQREDPKIKEVLKTFGHVVVYNFEQKSKQWSKGKKRKEFKKKMNSKVLYLL
jgi:hypothetical protein